MNPANYRLSKEVLQEMLNQDQEKAFGKIDSMYGTDVQGLSPADTAQHWINDIFTRLSEPLKKMQVEYLTKAGKTCYKE